MLTFHNSYKFLVFCGELGIASNELLKNCFLIGGDSGDIVKVSLECVQAQRVATVVRRRTAVLFKAYSEVRLGRISGAKIFGPFG